MNERLGLAARSRPASAACRRRRPALHGRQQAGSTRNATKYQRSVASGCSLRSDTGPASLEIEATRSPSVSTISRNPRSLLGVPARHDSLRLDMMGDSEMYPALEREPVIHRDVVERRNGRVGADRDFLGASGIGSARGGWDDVIVGWVGIGEEMVEADDIDAVLGGGGTDLQLERFTSRHAPAVEIAQHVHWSILIRLFCK